MLKKHAVLLILSGGTFMSFVGLYMRLLSQADGFQILFFRSLSLCLIVLMVCCLRRKVTPLMFLRGKIAFLFKKYSSNLAINNLLFCIKDEQIDVVELASILNEWINTNIGDSIENRSNAISNLNTNPLFIIFTFFNKQLKFDSTNDEMDLNYKWENRFNRFFQQEIVSSSYNWDTNWTSNNQLFKNFFLLRDFLILEIKFLEIFLSITSKHCLKFIEFSCKIFDTLEPKSDPITIEYF